MNFFVRNCKQTVFQAERCSNKQSLICQFLLITYYLQNNGQLLPKHSELFYCNYWIIAIVELSLITVVMQPRQHPSNKYPSHTVPSLSKGILLYLNFKHNTDKGANHFCLMIRRTSCTEVWLILRQKINTNATYSNTVYQLNHRNKIFYIHMILETFSVDHYFRKKAKIQ